MQMKKFFAVVLAAVMTLSFLPLFATAEYKGEPTCLYVGERDVREFNLIEKYENEHHVRVYSMLNGISYYEVTKEPGVGYVLTFYKDYQNSDLVREGTISAVVYCDGDLTIRSEGTTVLDANIKPFNTKADNLNAYGIYVEGTLNIEGTYTPAGVHVPGTLKADGSLSRANGSVRGHIGIYADSILVNEDTIIANGGRAALYCEDTFAMIRATIYANRDSKMKRGSECLFDYSFVTTNYIQYYGMTSAAGEFKVTTGHVDPDKNEVPSWPGNQFDNERVIFDRAYRFEHYNGFSGRWLDTAELYYNARNILPDCVHIYRANMRTYSAKVNVDQNRILLQAPGRSAVVLYLHCGGARQAISVCEVNCTMMWWQWPFYALSGTWLRVWLANTFDVNIGLGADNVL